MATQYMLRNPTAAGKPPLHGKPPSHTRKNLSSKEITSTIRSISSAVSTKIDRLQTDIRELHIAKEEARQLQEKVLQLENVNDALQRQVNNL